MPASNIDSTVLLAYTRTIGLFGWKEQIAMSIENGDYKQAKNLCYHAMGECQRRAVVSGQSPISDEADQVAALVSMLDKLIARSTHF